MLTDSAAIYKTQYEYQFMTFIWYLVQVGPTVLPVAVGSSVCVVY